MCGLTRFGWAARVSMAGVVRNGFCCIEKACLEGLRVWRGGEWAWGFVVASIAFMLLFSLLPAFTPGVLRYQHHTTCTPAFLSTHDLAALPFAPSELGTVVRRICLPTTLCCHCSPACVWQAVSNCCTGNLMGYLPSCSTARAHTRASVCERDRERRERGTIRRTGSGALAGTSMCQLWCLFFVCCLQ